MLTDDDVIADLSRLRERSEGIEYTGEVPLTRRSVAATVVPVAAVAAVATLAAAAVVGAGHDGPGAGPGTTGSGSTATSVDAGPSDPTAGGGRTATPIKLVSAKITLGGKTYAYQHAVGEDPFGDGWQLAIDFGASLPADATRFDLGGGESSGWRTPRTRAPAGACSSSPPDRTTATSVRPPTSAAWTSRSS